MIKYKFLIFGSYAHSLLTFRAPLISALQTKGYEVHVVSPGLAKNTQLCNQLESTGLIVHDVYCKRTGINPFGDLRCLFELIYLMLKIRPHFFLGYTIKPVIYGSIAAWLSAVPERFAMIEGMGYVFTSNSNYVSLGRRLLKFLVLKLYKLGCSCAKMVILLNPDDLNELVDLRIVSREKTFLLGGVGVDLNLWSSPLPLQSNPLTFILVARLLREKGVVEYFRAARLVKKQFPNTRFLLLGGLDENPGALDETDIQVWVAEGVIEWKGHVAVRPWMEQANVFVLPSYREGVPVSTQEAMAMGRAIITTDAPGCRETVVNGDNGFLVPVRDHQALASAMMRFINEPELVIRMGNRSRELAKERFDLHKINKILLQQMKICQ